MEDTSYSYVKEFFAAIDDTYYGWPKPFNYESVPILLRLLDKYWKSKSSIEFLEALQIRYTALTIEQGDNPDDFPVPKTI